MPARPNEKPPNHYGWTEERRAAARERALKNKPWQHSTGPRTEAGKARISQNARKYPIHMAEIMRLSKEMLDLNQAFVARFRLITKLQYGHLFIHRVRPYASKNKLIKSVLKQAGVPPPPQNIINKLIKSNIPHPRSLRSLSLSHKEHWGERADAGLAKNEPSRSWVREKEER